ncbi:MAG TPA: hypothetical protein VGR35_03860 [Tepidisphaeraceae bacterium]|nr:hypothetical protein [Tepidisphaeraceae bacterium]
MTISSYQRARFLLSVGSIGSFLLCWFTAAAIGIPAHPNFDASLLQQPSPALVLFIALVLTVACALFGSAVAGTIRFEAGLATAAIGLLALSIRGGPIRYTLMYSTGQVFISLAMELLILYAILGVGWAVLWLLRNSGWLQDDPFRDGVADIDEPVTQKLAALATQAVVMAIIMMILCETDRKPQVIASVGLAAFVGTLAAHSLFPARPSLWYWTGPLLVGVVGYLLAYSGSSTAWAIGEVGGTFAPELGRPLPLDYVGAGPAGAIIGYWTSRRWQRMREADAAAAAMPTAS